VCVCINYRNVNVPSEVNVGRYSSVGIATRYSVGGPGFEPRWGARIFGSVRTSPETHPTPSTVTAGCLYRG
jgi:hypothetical protein